MLRCWSNDEHFSTPFALGVEIMLKYAMQLQEVLEKAAKIGDLNREEIACLLSLEAENDINALFKVADDIRREQVGDEVHVRGLIEFSNICARSCLYCGLRSENSSVHRYRMPIEEIIDTALKVAGLGIGTIVLQSGEDPWFTADRISEIVRGIKSRANVAITLSIGERECDEYRIMKEAGADRFLIRHETATPDLYHALHPGSSFERRVECLHMLRELDYQIGCGCMVGLPGQGIENLVDDIMFIKELQPDMVGIGPFIPHPDTPLHDSPIGDLTLTLKMVALARIVTRNALIPATTAVGSIDELGREKALQVGANVMMPNYTPMKYRVDYEIYPNKRCINEDPMLCHGCMKMRIESIGRKVAQGPGHSYKREGVRR